MEIPDIPLKEIQLHDDDKKCAPGYNFTDGSCIPLKVLNNLAIAYNEYYSNDQIKLYKSTYYLLAPEKYKRYLTYSLTKRLHDVSENQKDWFNQEFAKNVPQTPDDFLKPYGPEGQYEWLSTVDINKIMEQYERLYPEFLYLGTVPKDFEKLDLNYNKFSPLDFNKMRNKFVGAVINLDNHDQDGSHWVALVLDYINSKIYFFDSYGTEPPQEIIEYMRKVAANMKFVNGHVDVDYSKLRHQYKYSECGVYSTYFILALLQKEKTFNDFNTIEIPDEIIHKKRDQYLIRPNQL